VPCMLTGMRPVGPRKCPSIAVRIAEKRGGLKISEGVLPHMHSPPKYIQKKQYPPCIMPYKDPPPSTYHEARITSPCVALGTPDQLCNCPGPTLRPARTQGIELLIGGKQYHPRLLCSSHQRQVLHRVIRLITSWLLVPLRHSQWKPR